MLQYKYLFLFLLSLLFSTALLSCVDDTDLSYPQESKEDDSYLKDIPEEILNGFSISFGMGLDPMGGEAIGLATSANDLITNESLRTIENFVDLEKLRVLFFVCLDDNDTSGKSDVFLFEAKSRWVSVISDDKSTSGSWMVTSPIFSYGNNGEYSWQTIQEILTKRPFKIAVLANRPDVIRFSDFDNAGMDTDLKNNPYVQKGDNGEFFFINKGPYWAVDESEEAIKFYNDLVAKGEDGFKNVENPIINPTTKTYKYAVATINDLHHCQWDATYASKNSNTANGTDVYNFILKNPDTVDKYNPDKNWMGSCSFWTKWKWDDAAGEYKNDGSSKKTKYNWYYHPSTSQGIPMYGVQKYNAMSNWEKGTPFNVSERQVGDDGTYVRKNIHLLRSLARIDLIIPKSLGKVDPSKCMLQYSNVFARCEPIDVATPTDELWKSVHTETNNPQDQCEFWNIYTYGPIVDGSITSTGENREYFLKRMAWFYGAWKDWWDFNGLLDGKTAYFDDASTKYSPNRQPMPYPRIFNPCIQRNQYAYLDDVILDYDKAADNADTQRSGDYHFVIYTGERNINDPSKFTDYRNSASELVYFVLNFEGSDYRIPLTNYTTNTLLKNFPDNSKANTNYNLLVPSSNDIMTSYKAAMASNGTRGNWNWPILRNHVYTFRVRGFGSNKDNSGLDELVISTEDRFTPDINYY